MARKLRTNIDMAFGGYYNMASQLSKMSLRPAETSGVVSRPRAFEHGRKSISLDLYLKSL